MEQTKVCGVGQSLTVASSKALERLLDQFGRNGPMSVVQAEKKAGVEKVLQARRKKRVPTSTRELH